MMNKIKNKNKNKNRSKNNNNNNNNTNTNLYINSRNKIIFIVQIPHNILLFIKIIKMK